MLPYLSRMDFSEKLRLGIKNIVSRISRIDIAELKDSVLIREELGIDSLMAMEIIATCEKTWGVDRRG